MNGRPEDGDAGVVGVLVDAHDEHGRVGWRRGDDDLLAAALDVQLRLLDRREHTRRLDHVLDAALAPRDLRRVFPRYDCSPQQREQIRRGRLKTRDSVVKYNGILGTDFVTKRHISLQKL